MSWRQAVSSLLVPAVSPVPKHPGYPLGNQVIELKTSWSSLHPLAMVCYSPIQSLPFCKMLKSPSLECVTIGPISAFSAKAKTSVSCLISNESQSQIDPQVSLPPMREILLLNTLLELHLETCPSPGMFHIGQCLHPSVGSRPRYTVR